MYLYGGLKFFELLYIIESMYNIVLVYLIEMIYVGDIDSC